MVRNTKTMTEITNQTGALTAAPAPKPLIRRIWNRSWPQAVVAFGLALTIIWVFILGYGLVELVHAAL
jgi:hypothetical protein